MREDFLAKVTLDTGAEHKEKLQGRNNICKGCGYERGWHISGEKTNIPTNSSVWLHKMSEVGSAGE